MAPTLEKLKISGSLFMHEDGRPISFYMRPCNERKEIKPLIEQGGGTISCHETKDSIKLSVTGNVSCGVEDTIQAQYVVDCARANKLLDMTLYRGSQFSDDGLSPSSHIIKTKAASTKGRQKYTETEDMKIVRYLIEEQRYSEVKGKKLWQDMSLFEVTKHSSESMRTRYLKVILPNIKSYSFPSPWVAKLTGNAADAVEESIDTVQASQPPSTEEISKKTPPNTSPLVYNSRMSASSLHSSQSPSNHGERSQTLCDSVDSASEDDFDKMLLLTAKDGCEQPLVKKSASRNTRIMSPNHSSRKECKHKTIVNSGKGVPQVLHTAKKQKMDLGQEEPNRSLSSTPDSYDGHLLEAGNEMMNRLNETFGIQSCQMESLTTSQSVSKKSLRKTTKMKGSKAAIEDRKTLHSRYIQGQKTGIKSLVNYLMKDSESLSQESNVSEPETEDYTDIGELKKVAHQFGMTLEEMQYVVFINSGREKDAVHWIKFGFDTQGYPAWSEMDDKILEGTDEKNLAVLEMKHGSKRIIDRSIFLEGGT